MGKVFQDEKKKKKISFKLFYYCNLFVNVCFSWLMQPNVTVVRRKIVAFFST